MNHLAHIFLAGAQADAQLGGLLGDFWRGAPDPEWPPTLRAGVELHRKIDVYTDSHPIVAEARRLFDAPLRRYAGILLDMYFDHVLARDWAQFSSTPLATLSARTLDLVVANATRLPPDLMRFADYMRLHGLFASYARRATIEQALGGISRRLRRANPVADAGPALWQRHAELDLAFAKFFPELQLFAREQRARLGLDVEAPAT
jgi:acyl carrier protein phosphodiesterase